MLKKILKRLKRLAKSPAIMMLILLSGYAACDPCGEIANFSSNGDPCKAFDLAGTQGFPYGPVTIKWYTMFAAKGYVINIGSDYGNVGQSIVDGGSTSSTVVTLDQDTVNKVIAGNGMFYISGTAAVGVAGECEFYATWTYKKEAKKAKPTETFTPVPANNNNNNSINPPQQQHPQANQQTATPIVIIPIRPIKPTSTLAIPR